jgi:solute carrier family 25 (mitochondrial S-adenosylmethionine transporter), member 26
MSQLLFSFLSGGIAGCCVDLILFPLDSIKTKIQSKQPLVFSPSAIYKGLFWSLASSFPCAATFWTAYTFLKLLFLIYFSDSYLVDFFSACFGSFCCCLIRCPFELMKTQMVSGKYKYFYEAPADIIAKDGIKGLFVGLLALICRELPFDSIQMMFYRSFSRIAWLGFEYGPISVSGALAGGVTAFLTTPVDVIKTKIMTDPEKHRTIASTVRFTLKTDGVEGLYRGWKIRVMYITAGGWIYFGMFKFMMQVLGKSDIM